MTVTNNTAFFLKEQFFIVKRFLIAIKQAMDFQFVVVDFVIRIKGDLCQLKKLHCTGKF